MNSPLFDIWEKTLEIIKSELTEVSFNTWLKTIEPISYKNNQIVLGVPNVFTKGILEARYMVLISNALIEVTGEETNIKFSIPGDTIENNTNKNNNETNTGSFSSANLIPNTPLKPL